MASWVLFSGNWVCLNMGYTVVYMGIPQVHRFSIIFPCFEWPLWGYTATLFSQLGSVSHEVAVCKTHTIPGNMLDG